MGLITGVCTFLYHLPQIYKWLLRPYYITSFLMTVAFLVVRKAPGLCEHLATQREDGNSCDFDWVSTPGDWVALQCRSLLNMVDLSCVCCETVRPQEVSRFVFFCPFLFHRENLRFSCSSVR